MYIYIYTYAYIRAFKQAPHVRINTTGLAMPGAGKQATVAGHAAILVTLRAFSAIFMLTSKSEVTVPSLDNKVSWEVLKWDPLMSKQYPHRAILCCDRSSNSLLPGGDINAPTTSSN